MEGRHGRPFIRKAKSLPAPSHWPDLSHDHPIHREAEGVSVWAVLIEIGYPLVVKRRKSAYASSWLRTSVAGVAVTILLLECCTSEVRNVGIC